MSEKSIAEKLLIKDNYRVLLINAPDSYRTLLGELPANVDILRESAGPVDLIQVFVTSMKEAEERLPQLKSVLKPKGLLWVTYPKGTSRFRTDVNRDIIRSFSATIGMQVVVMISIDDTWSAMRLKIE